MKRKIVTIGVLAGAAALTGLTGAAYAADGGGTGTTSAGVVSVPAAKVVKGGAVIACVSMKEGGKAGLKDFVKAFPGKPPKGAQTVVISTDGKQVKAFGKADAPVTIKLDPSKVKGVPALPKDAAVRCTQAPVGTTLPALPALPASPGK